MLQNSLVPVVFELSFPVVPVSEVVSVPLFEDFFPKRVFLSPKINPNNNPVNKRHNKSQTHHGHLSQHPLFLKTSTVLFLLLSTGGGGGRLIESSTTVVTPGITCGRAGVTIDY